jgi:hypothetical protein
MQLNLPILEALANSQTVLIAGAGGGQDVLAGLPLYFTLREHDKTVHLANYTFGELTLAPHIGEAEILAPDLVVGARGKIRVPFPYFPEGYLAQWFQEKLGLDVTVWMLGHAGVLPLAQSYQRLQEHLHFDALVLVDGGVDSIMRGNEYGAGTLLEDTISLAAAQMLDPAEVPVKILACLGFGSEVEEAVCHYNALENMAALAREGAFYGVCALTPQMQAFQLYEAAARYIWDQPKHPKSHISTRVIPAVRGEFGDHHMYEDDRATQVLISPLMALYWFFNADTVAQRSLIAPLIQDTLTTSEAFQIVGRFAQTVNGRPRRALPY